MSEQTNDTVQSASVHTPIEERSLKRWLAFSFLCPLVGCGALCFIPLVSFHGTLLQIIGAYLIAVLFWGAVIGETVLAFCCRRVREEMENSIFRCESLQQSRPGMISSFKNREGMITDIILFLSMACVIVMLWLQVQVEWMILVGVLLFLLSLYLHCIFNGRNYRYYKAYTKKKKEMGYHD